MNKRAIIIAAISLCSCATGADNDTAEINRIEKKCGVAKGTLRLDKKVGFTFNPDPNEKYEKVNCALAELRSSSLWRHMKYGFVGNESPAKEGQK